MTSGLSANRGSKAASGTTMTPSPPMASTQKDCSRGVETGSKPTLALNHCWSSVTKLIRAVGVPQTWAASSTASSNSGCGAVCNTP